jgi:hypothetical protein
MKNRFFVLIAMLALGTAALLAADFWKTKKFTEWSSKEVDKMLADSPWARRTALQMEGGRGGGTPGGGGRRRGGGMAFLPQDEGGGGDMGGGGGLGGGGGMGGGRGESGPPLIEVVVRWQTALPVKQAFARLQYKDEAGSSPEAAKLLNREENYYVVAIVGVPEGAAGIKPEDMKAGAQLLINKLSPIQAADVIVNKQATSASFYLVFPRTQSGAHVITLGDKDVEVVLKAKPITVKRKFKLADMVFNGKLEL